MKKMLFVAALALSAQFVHASEQDLLPLEVIGEGSILTINSAILIPAGSTSVSVYRLGGVETRSIDSDLKSGNSIAGCSVTLAAASQRVRRIPVNTQLTISDIEKSYNKYTITIENSPIESLECLVGFVYSDNDDTRPPTAAEIREEEVTTEDEQVMSLLDFNTQFASMMSIAPSDAQDIGADNSDRATAEAPAAAAAPAAEATAAATQE